jgi:hypothetical protein
MHDPCPLTTLGNDGKLSRVQGGIPVPGEETCLPALVGRCRGIFKVLPPLLTLG